MNTKITRRQFLKASVLAGAAAAAPGVLLRPQKAYAFSQSQRLRKFVQPLRGLGPAGIPVLTPDQKTYPGVDYYEVALGTFTDQLHPDLPKATQLYGYADANNPNFKHLGGLIVAQQGTPVRMRFVNQLPATHILPVDTTIPGAETGQAQNRAAVHLHGGHIPWISDGGPFHWFAPDGTTGPSMVKWLPDNNGNLTTDHYYPNRESSRLMWYHDHAVGITRLNAYAGLATGYVIRDGVEASLIKPDGSGLPDLAENGGREIPLIIQDKIFKRVADQWGSPGDLWYSDAYDPTRWPVGVGGAPPYPSAVPEFSGDTMLVNGSVYPFVDVEPRRYRLRILNACNTRFCRLQLFYALGSAFPDSTEPDLTKPGPKFRMIGNECGFLDGSVLPRGVMLRNILLAPAERGDIIVDFSKVPPGAILILCNDAPAPYPAGDPRNDYYPGAPNNPTISKPGFGPNTRTLMQFRVGKRVGAPDPRLKLALPPAKPAMHVPWGVTDLPPGVRVRDLTLNEDFDTYGRLIQRVGTNVRLHPPSFGRDYLDPVTERVKRNSTEVWRIFNLSADTHPMHFHMVNAQIISRQTFDMKTFNGKPTFTGPAVPPQPYERGWKETVRMNPGECTTIIMTFDLPANPPGIRIPTSPRTGGYEYVYHCHILEHEEHDMMRPLVVK